MYTYEKYPLITFFALLIITYTLYIIIKLHKILYKSGFISIDELYDIADTGDLIYFRYHEVHWTHEIISPFTHIGMVVTIDNKKYILETHMKGDTENIGVFTGGIHTYPLKTRLLTYDGHVFLSKLKNEFKPSNIDINLFINKINDYKIIPFTDDYKQFFLRKCLKTKICNICFENKNTNKSFTCSEFIGFCLRELGILDEKFIYSCLVPGEFQFIKKNNKIIFDNFVKLK